MYDPTVGRWLQLDPIDFDAGDANLQRYVGNSPTNRTDPSGLEAQPATMRPAHIPEPIWEALLKAWSDSFVPREQMAAVMAAQGVGVGASSNLASVVATPIINQINKPYNAVREQGGSIFKDKTGKIIVRFAPPGGINEWTVNASDVPKKEGETLIGDFHTHPYRDIDDQASGTSFSAADIMGSLSGSKGTESYLISNDYIYVMIIRDPVRAANFAPNQDRKVYTNNLAFVSRFLNQRTPIRTADSTHKAVRQLFDAIGVDVLYYRIKVTPTPSTRMNGLAFRSAAEAVP